MIHLTLRSTSSIGIQTNNDNAYTKIVTNNIHNDEIETLAQGCRGIVTI